MKAKLQTPFQGFGLLALCLVVLAGIGAGGYLYIAAERRSFDTEARNQLATIADMKVRQVASWREEQLAEAKVSGSNPFTVRELMESLDLGRNQADIETWMRLRMDVYHYAAMSLWDRDGRRRLGLPAGGPAKDEHREFILHAMRGQAPVFGDLQRDVPAGKVYLPLAVPIVHTSSPEPIGALLLEIDPGQFLYPLIQSWPIPSPSAETLLVRREGDEVVFLNELRHLKDTALKLRFPITRTGLPAAKGAAGYEGTMQGVDYRGVPVLAATRTVPGSSWVMVAKVDKEEILAPQSKRTRLLLGFFGLAGVTLLGGILFLSSRQAEAVVRASEVRYRRLFESAKDGILILDAETGIVLDANSYMTELLGFPHEAFLGKRLWELGFFKDVVANEDNFLELQRKGYVRYEDLPLEAADGRRRDVEFVSNVYLADGRKVIQCNIRDITERKRADELLRVSEERHRSILHMAMEGFWVVDAEGRLLEVNEAYCRMSGYSQEELLTMRVSDLKEGAEAEGGAGRIQQIITQGEARFESRQRRKDGSILDLEVSAQYQPEEGGRLVGFLRDITDRKRAEEKLRANESVLSESQSVAHVGSWSWDLATGKLTWTSETYRLHGVSPDTFVPSLETLLSLIHADDRAAMQGWLAACLAGEDPPPLEFRALLPDGGVRHIHAHGSLVRDAKNQPIRISGIALDITERRRGEEERRSLQLQLAEAQKMESVGRLAGGIAHDFNNLLNIIMGYGGMALRELSQGKPITKSLAEIQKAAERAAELTSQLLAFSRRQVLQPKPLGLNSLIADCEGMLRRIIGEDVELVINPGPRVGLVKADPSQLQQVIMNLAVNSRDAMPYGGTLTIEAADVVLDQGDIRVNAKVKYGPYVMLAVRDTGLGMDQETQAQIFDPFFTTKEIGKGTGLGLSMVYGIVEQSGGYITVHSEAGQGTEFKIYLPRVFETPEPVLAEEVKTIQWGGETILVAEDEPTLRELIGRLLEDAGYEVLLSRDVQEAIQIATQHKGRLDLLLTDVVMPGLSGPQLAEHLRPVRPDMKVLYMSGYPDPLKANSALEPEANLIQKPFTEENLRRRLRELLEG